MGDPDLPLRLLLTPGFRPAEALCGKLPHSLRVLVAGDSYAYGHGVSQHEALPSQLQAELNRDPGLPFCEVVNLGRPGLSVYDELEVLRQVAARVEADLLVLCLSSDDASPLPRLVLDRGSREQRERWRLQWHPEGRDFAHFLRVLGTIAKDQRQARRQLVVAFYEPVTGTDRLPLAVLPAVCETLAVPFVDLCSPFARFAPEALQVSKADSHPSPLAHRIAAVELAAVLRPLLAGRSSTPAGGDAGSELLAERLAWLRAAEESQGCTGRLVYGHVGERCGSRQGAGCPPATGRLRELLNWRLRAALLHELARAAQPEVAALGEQLLDLRRQLLLAQLGVDGAAPEAAAWRDAEELLLPACRRLLQLLVALDEGGPATAGDTAEDAGEGRDAAEAVVAGCARRLTREVEVERAQNRMACGGLRELLDEVGLVTARGHDLGTVPGRALELGRGIARSLERLSALLGASQEGGLESRAEIVAEVELGPEPDVLHVDLVADCTVLFPYCQIHRQVHYILRDGLRHAYRLDLPRGVMAGVVLQLRRYRDSGVEMAAGEEEIKSVWLARGDERSRYAPGRPLLASFPRP
jgi:lysophospholipase L1-like esterase